MGSSSQIIWHFSKKNITKFSLQHLIFSHMFRAVSWSCRRSWLCLDDSESLLFSMCEKREWGRAPCYSGVGFFG